MIMPARIQPFPPDLPLVPSSGDRAIERLVAKRDSLRARIERLPLRSQRRAELCHRLSMVTLALMQLETRSIGHGGRS